MHRLRLLLLALVALVVVLGLGGGAGAWWYHTTRPEYRLRRGQEALRRGDRDEAQRLAALLEAGGWPDHAHLLRGEIFLRERNVARAIDALNKIREENEPIRLEAAVSFGLGFLSLDRPREAEHLLLYVLSRTPDCLDAHRGLAALYFDQGAKGLAVLHTREWVRLAPEDGNGWRFLGIIYSDFGDSNAWAIDAFREALRQGLEDQAAEEVKLELADLLVKQTESVQALQVLDELDAKSAASQKALELRCECLWRLNQSSELKPLLDSALRAYPSSVPLLRLRGQIQLGSDEPKAATADLERALQIDRHDHGSRYLLAQAYEVLGRRVEAAEQRRRMEESQRYFKEMSELSTLVLGKPWDTSLHLRLAELCEKLDRYPEAAAWRKAAARPVEQPLSGQKDGKVP